VLCRQLIPNDSFMINVSSFPIFTLHSPPALLQINCLRETGIRFNSTSTCLSYDSCDGPATHSWVSLTNFVLFLFVGVFTNVVCFLGLTTFFNTIGCPFVLYLTVVFLGSEFNFLFMRCVAISSSVCVRGWSYVLLSNWFIIVGSDLFIGDVATSTVRGLLALTGVEVATGVRFVSKQIDLLFSGKQPLNIDVCNVLAPKKQCAFVNVCVVLSVETITSDMHSSDCSDVFGIVSNVL